MGLIRTIARLLDMTEVVVDGLSVLTTDQGARVMSKLLRERDNLQSALNGSTEAIKRLCREHRQELQHAVDEGQAQVAACQAELARRDVLIGELRVAAYGPEPTRLLN